MNKSNFIEFTGLPGSGKTRLAHAATELLKECTPEELVEFMEKANLPVLNNSGFGKVKTPLSLVTEVLLSPGIIRFPMAHARNKAAVIRFYKLLALRKISRHLTSRPNVWVVEQHLLQGVWAFLLHCEHLTAHTDAIEELIHASYIRWPQAVFHLTLSPEIAIQRLQARQQTSGHNPTDFDLMPNKALHSWFDRGAECITKLTGIMTKNGVPVITINADNTPEQMKAELEKSIRAILMS